MSLTSQTPFTHLHVHTQYSLLDGANRIEQMIARVKSLGMTSVAMTDHGNLYGAIHFYREAKKQGIKPILGCEVYVTPKSMTDRQDRVMYHLTLLAQNQTGFHNLRILTSQAHLNGFYYYPRIDKELLARHSEGIICLSGCISAEVPRHILTNETDRVKSLIQEYRSIFAPECYYLEVMNNGLREQEIVNKALIELSSTVNLPLVVTNDCHYLTSDDADAHEILVCIQTGKTIEDSKRMKSESKAFYIKSPEEMIAENAHIPQAIESTKQIADKCNVKLKFGDYYLPHFDLPKDENLESYLDNVTNEGLKRRLDFYSQSNIEVDEKAYWDRLEIELKIIKDMGFPGYFLIVWDFIQYAKKHDIPVGPGRGSAAGSIVAYALEIIDVDPIPYNLLFERFLNPERISMPDIDIDFCRNRRDEVIQYVVEKYGKENVAQIITYGTLKARGVIRDVGRVLGMPYGEVDKVAKLVPEVLNITLSEAIKVEKELAKLRDSSPMHKKLLDYALRLEGLYRHSGVHAAGLVIGEKPLWHYTPLARGENGKNVTQYSMSDLEEVGLVKFDFLGLKTLTVVDGAVKLIQKHTPDFDIRRIPMTDDKTFALIQAGKTDGVFQMESSGFKELLKKLKPDCFEDIIAAGALYRPGPLGSGMVDDFCKRKNGQIPIAYPHPMMEDVLKETYGVIVYQEQVMKIASHMGGFTLGQADLLRRAMGKKKAKVMAEQKAIFVEGAKGKNIPEDKACEVFDLMAYFSGYGFNKSHSTAYGLITYQTAYLKSNYPKEFMAALLTSEMDRLDKVTRYIEELKQMKIAVLPPCVNESDYTFSVVKKGIRFGLGAIKNVGQGAIEDILENRNQNGAFSHLFEFTSRIDLKKSNRKTLESLVKCGAFDFSNVARSQQFSAIDDAILRGNELQKEKNSAQMNIFDMGGEPDEIAMDIPIQWPDIKEWSSSDRLKFEKELTGVYISGHPLSKVNFVVKSISTHDTDTLKDSEHDTVVKIAGLPSVVKVKLTKRGDKMAFVTLEDLLGTVEVIIFPKTYERVAEILDQEKPLVVEGVVLAEDESIRVRADKMYVLDTRWKEQSLILHVEKDETLNQMTQLKDMLVKYPGTQSIYVELYNQKFRTTISLGSEYKVKCNEVLLKNLNDMFGRNVVRFR